MAIRVFKNKVACIYLDVYGTADSGDSTNLVSSTLSNLSADLYNDGILEITEGVCKGERVTISNMSSDGTISFATALSDSAIAGKGFRISPPHDAASARKYVLGGVLEHNVDATMLERKDYSTTLDQMAAVNARNIAEFIIKSEIKGQGAAGTEAEYSKMLQAANFTMSNLTSKIQYTPHSDEGESLTCYMWRDGERFVERFGKCNLSLKWTAGEYGEFSWNIKGIWEEPVDHANPTPSYDSTMPIKIARIAFKIGTSVYPIISSFELDIGNNIAIVDDATGTEGVHSFRITDRDPRGKMTIAAEAQTIYDVWDKMVNNTLEAIQVIIGDVSGNIFVLDAPKMQILNPQIGELEGYVTLDIDFALRQNAGNDSVVLATK